jgi:hypothetical protein
MNNQCAFVLLSFAASPKTTDVHSAHGAVFVMLQGLLQLPSCPLTMKSIKLRWLLG